jgi:hypothetical protein
MENGHAAACRYQYGYIRFRTIKTVALWDISKSPPASAEIAGALSLVLWLSVITFGRLIGFAASAMQDPFATL